MAVRIMMLCFLQLAASYVCANGNGPACKGVDGFPLDENDPSLPVDCNTSTTVPAGQDCLCLASGILSEKRRNITYAKNATHSYNGPVLDMGVKWASGQVVSALVKILLEEGLGYNYKLVGITWNGVTQVRGPSGCKDLYSPTEPCDEYDEYDPQFHLGLEGWSGANTAIRNNLVPVERRALQLTKHTYTGREGLFVMKSEMDRAYFQNDMVLASYKGWNVTKFPEISTVFHNLGEAIAKMPGGKLQAEALRITPGADIGMRKYANTKYANMTGDSGDWCYNATTGLLTSDNAHTCLGNVWISPACRPNPLACIPTWTTGGWCFAELTQWAAFYNMPLAIIDTTWGEYIVAPKKTNSVFYWWFPDTIFSKNAPERVAMPSYNPDEHTDLLFKTGLADTEVSKFCWHHLGIADKGRGVHIIFMLERIAIYDSEMVQLMVQRGNGMSAEDVACGFARNYEHRWREWIPQNINWCESDEMMSKDGNCVACKNGYVPTADTSDCVPCAAGYYCPRGSKPILCHPGFFCPNASIAQKPCQEGTFASHAGANVCSKCAPGTYMSKAGGSVCQPCPVGFHSEKLGAVACTPCALGTYQREEGTSECDSCSATFTTLEPGAKSVGQCTCARGFYWHRANDMCTVCQPESFCIGGLAPPLVYENFYAQFVPPGSGDAARLITEETAKINGTYVPRSGTFTNVAIWKCASWLECPQNATIPLAGVELAIGVRRPNECPPSREGIACAVCEVGRFGPACASCEEQPAVAVLIALLLLLPLFMFLIGQWYRGCDYEARADVYFVIGAMGGLILFYGQCVGIISSFNIDWAPAVKPTMDATRFFLLDMRDAVTMCITGTSFMARYLEALLVPVLLIVAILVAYGMSRLLSSFHGYELSISWECSVNVSGTMFAVLYVYLVKNTCTFFECIPNPAAAATLAAYKQVECGSERHSRATAPMVLGMIFYVVGFFSLCLYLSVAAPRFFSRKSFRECIYFHVYRWKPSMWYWSQLFMIRNCMIATINSMAQDGTSQLILMSSVLVVFTVATCWTTPWKSMTLSYVDGISCGLLLTMLSCGHAVILHGGKIRGLLLDGKVEEIAVHEEMLWKIFLSWLYLNVLLCAGVVVLLAQMGNGLRPSVRFEQREREKLAMKHLCEVFQDMCSHSNFDTALKQTVEIASEQDTAAMSGIVRSIGLRLADDALQSRVGQLRRGTRIQLRRGHTVAVNDALVPGETPRPGRGGGSAKMDRTTSMMIFANSLAEQSLVRFDNSIRDSRRLTASRTVAPALDDNIPSDALRPHDRPKDASDDNIDS